MSEPASIPIPFAIGEELWHIGHGSRQERVTCPECLGTKVITMVRADGATFEIDCAGCARGYEPAEGWITVTISEHEPTLFRANSVHFSCGEISYSTAPQGAGCYTTVRATDLYRTREECAARCAEENAKKHEYEKGQVLRNALGRKRDMAWSVHYWSRQIREREVELVYYRARLRECKEKKMHLKMNREVSP